MSFLVVVIPVACFALIVLVLGTIVLIRCRREDIPDIVLGLGQWFQATWRSK